ncbi:glycoside hydrolase family 3 C-terminal domain-containing protein [Clostridium sp. YIM B02515]|uniref:beta-N-acetylhexosaminidase n=1 Tax=Clostridium rhizosphaerae TaxID=2803861 RepID=A0ABS1T8A7_9CLOT|nr:glycoside hydrolase family 3 protein [Clostridium rhizosphaerae]MBL4934238.1 glycoside hydrolase family 3 C-terminal domain-containing protein [Clostridium rhizosphaerae]
MKRRNLLKTFSVALSLLLAVPAINIHANTTDPVKPGWKDEKAQRGWIESKIQHMTLEEKVGQLFMIHVYGKTPTDPNYEQTNLSNNRGAKNFEEAIQKYHIGGIIYFNWSDNIGTPVDFAQVNALSNGIEKIAMDQRMPIPLLIATDQEGGIVARVTEPATVFPGNMALGATRSADYATKMTSIMGSELRKLGINFDLAPVLDVNINPDNPVIGVRSMSENAGLVAQLGAAQIKGYQSQNIIASAKHFPGHGDTNTDSHYGLPIINHDLQTLNEIDLKPFKAAIAAGIDSIMTAHIVVPALDNSGLPATLSKPILTDLLRNKLGYEGIIITDSLGMSGANVVPADRVAAEAFLAGADILLNPPDVDVAYNGVLNAVKSGEITEKRLDESVFRILKVKMKSGLFSDPYAAPEKLNQIGTAENLKFADELTDKSITLIKNENSLLPLKQGTKVLVTGPATGNPALLSDQLTSKGFTSSSYQTSATPTTAQINTAKTKADAADVVIVTTYSSSSTIAHKDLVNALTAAGKTVIVAAMRNPYDLNAFPQVNGYVATYGNKAISTKALARVLTGEVNPTGKLPVTIRGLFDYGFGLGY